MRSYGSRMRLVAAVVLAMAACAPGPSTGGADAGGGGSGGGSGGSAASDLVFAVVGDTRPPSDDDTANYPTEIIGTIYQDIASETPRPQFAISTGDYQFASTTGSDAAAPQLGKYMAARAAFSGPLYPAMGNHECTGSTDSNCGTGNPDGMTKNLTAFLSMMVAPIGQTQPYYAEDDRRRRRGPRSSWSSRATRGTRRRRRGSTRSSRSRRRTRSWCVTRARRTCRRRSARRARRPSTQYPLTLLVVGHTHEYRHEKYDKELINGIGGAPLTSGTNYGYTIVSRNSDGTLTVTTYDYKTHATIDAFSITADGAAG